MGVIGIDLGGTKISNAWYDGEVKIVVGKNVLIDGAKGKEVGVSIRDLIKSMQKDALGEGKTITAAGISVPGIYNVNTGRVWAPNIRGWDDYPLLEELQQSFDNIEFFIASDRACYIMGELWKGKARGCSDAIFLAVGTGLAAGIMTGGRVLNGAHGIAGSIGWMALNKPFMDKYLAMGCAEYYASGEGIARYAHEVLDAKPGYKGIFRSKKKANAFNIINEYENGDRVAIEVMKNTVEYWGMVVANLVSTFNPEKIIFGGGVFSGAACKFLEAVYAEALKWGQPIGMKQVQLECSSNGDLAGLYGALYLAMHPEHVTR